MKIHMKQKYQLLIKKRKSTDLKHFNHSKPFIEYSNDTNEKLELPDGSYSVPDIQDYLAYILQKHEKMTDSPSVRTHVNKIENRITFKIKRGKYLEFLTLETMKLLERTEKKIGKDKPRDQIFVKVLDSSLLPKM